MTKIMLVEDDKSLREIYGVRLLAEGYDIVSAGDGELALAMAIKERPQLIISDVMMPKISGFDMLDILRSTTETRNIKVIMMTALSSEEQRIRGEQLGADRYLVKSQVGIEDVVRVVHEVLGDAPGAAKTATPAVAQPAQAPAQQQPQAQPPIQRAAPPPASAHTAPTPRPPESSIPKPTAPFSSPRPASLGERVIQPLKDNPRVAGVDMSQLMDREMAREAGNLPAPSPTQPAAPPVQVQAPVTPVSPQPAPTAAIPQPIAPPVQQSAPPSTPVSTQDINNELDQLIAKENARQQPAPAQTIPPVAPSPTPQVVPIQQTSPQPTPSPQAAPQAPTQPTTQQQMPELQVPQRPQQ